MPIDSAAKRLSAASFLMTLAQPRPDMMIDQADRQQVAWIYRGILAVIPVIGPLAVYAATVDDKRGYAATVQDV